MPTRLAEGNVVHASALAGQTGHTRAVEVHAVAVVWACGVSHQAACPINSHETNNDDNDTEDDGNLTVIML